MSKPNFENENYVAFKLLPLDGPFRRLQVLQKSDGTNRLDINVSEAAVRATAKTGLHDGNVDKWLWEKANGFLESTMPRDYTVLKIESKDVDNLSIVTRFEELIK